MEMIDALRTAIQAAERLVEPSNDRQAYRDARNTITGLKIFLKETQDGISDPLRPSAQLETKPTGGDVNYYVVDIKKPKRLAPYEAEAEDIIEALGMTFAEGNAFKALWRSCAARTLGLNKPGLQNQSIYDAEKIVYYAGRILAFRKGAKQ